MTETNDTQASLRAQAVERLRKKRDLTAHVLVYVLVNAVLWTIWALTGAGFPWPAIVAAAWGVGLVMNTWDVSGRRPIGEAEVQREMRRLRQNETRRSA